MKVEKANLDLTESHSVSNGHLIFNGHFIFNVSDLSDD